MKRLISILFVTLFFKASLGQVDYVLKNTTATSPLNTTTTVLYEDPSSRFLGVTTAAAPIYPFQIEKFATATDRQMIRVHNTSNLMGSVASIGISSGGGLNSGSFTQLAHYGANYTFGSPLNDASLLYGSGANGMYIQAANANPNTQISFKINTTEAMRIISNGFIGMGTTSPPLPLTVINPHSAGAMGVFASAAGRGITFHPNLTAGMVDIFSDFLGGAEPKLHLSTYANRATAEGITVDVTGNVGVGVTTPLTKLHAQGAQIASFTGNTRGMFSLSAPYVAGGLTSIDFLYMPGANPTTRIAAYHDGAGSKLMFGTSNNYASGITNTALIIDNVGNVGVGNLNPQSKLDVYAYDNYHYAATILNSGGSGQGLLIKSGAGTGAGAGLMVMDGLGNQYLKVDNYTGITYVKELKVRVPPFPDFVFEENYKLMTLSEREEFIRSNQHLPYLEAAKEVDKNGANVGNTLIGLVQNTEELTLYLLEMNKKIELLLIENIKLHKEIDAFKRYNPK